ncbi:MAG: UDP-N-acetylmuramoyl-L-alanine--D-glutamate ligase [Verrucomicrobia bacterium]|nr:UDP-N-acetylmuramoyl-L-alanine--D-glutamate ligase [Verrucomicrobiota bacterium]
MEKYRTVLILGYGRSGQAAERLLRAEGATVLVLAEESAGLPELIQALEKTPFDICVVSPGFALSHRWICAVREAGIPLLSELELGWSRHCGKTVAVTGSNGKSTAVKWICEMLQLAGSRAAIGGNYGIPACEVVLENPNLDWLVLEVSSFQLETVRDFHAEVAVLLNVLPNHLNRHETMEIYRRTKARIFGSSSLSGDACLVPVDLLPQLQGDLGGAERKWITFGSSPEADYFYRDGRVFRESDAVMDLSGTLFESPVLGGCTGASVAAVAQACGVPCSVAADAARRFEPLPHRLQRVGEIGGVAYVNDSKATNLAAMAVGLEACGQDIHLIAGGVPKESDYTFIKEILAERVRSIYLVGQVSRAMYQAWNGVCSCVECGTLETAFNTAQNAAKPGETVLLSPGCASFDQFRSFEERGERFMALFHESVQSGGDTG